MNRALIASLAVWMAVCACRAELPESSGCVGLTQAQLAKKLGFPLRVFMLPGKARGGPGVLFWSYYQRSTPTIEEKVFVFDGSPLKVSAAPGDVRPSLFLSLERPSDSLEILRYEAQHGR